MEKSVHDYKFDLVITNTELMSSIIKHIENKGVTNMNTALQLQLIKESMNELEERVGKLIGERV